MLYFCCVSIYLLVCLYSNLPLTFLTSTTITCYFSSPLPSLLSFFTLLSSLSLSLVPSLLPLLSLSPSHPPLPLFNYLQFSSLFSLSIISLAWFKAHAKPSQRLPYNALRYQHAEAPIGSPDWSRAAWLHPGVCLRGQETSPPTLIF